MDKDKPLTGVKKRKQIDDARKQVFLWVALGSAVVVTCLMVAWNLFQRIQYQAKVNGEISKANDQLKQDVDNVAKLQTNINALKTNTLLSKANLMPEGSTVFQVVIDALPTTDDRTTLGASLQDKILAGSGVTVDQIQLTNDGGSTTSTESDSSGETSSSSGSIYPTAQPITFKLVLKGSYVAIQKAMTNMESTIRPIIINKVVIDGTDAGLQATIDATTYYSPNVSFTTSEKEVEP